MARRPLVIAAALSTIGIAAITVHTISEMLAIPPMPPFMLCMTRNCPIAEYAPPPPLIAPRLSDIKPLDAPTKQRPSAKPPRPR